MESKKNKGPKTTALFTLVCQMQAELTHTMYLATATQFS